MKRARKTGRRPSSPARLQVRSSIRRFAMLIVVLGGWPAAHGADGRNGSPGDVASADKPPLSAIVEIQNHGDRFFDVTDSAVTALNRIGEVDEIWQAARAAKAHADANPADDNAQKAYRAARARFLHQRVAIFMESLVFEQRVQEAYEAFLNQLEIEIASENRQAETEAAAIAQHTAKYRDYVRQVNQLRAHVDSAADLDPQELELLGDVELEVERSRQQKMLAEERQLLVAESIRDLQATRIQVNQWRNELKREFKEARQDLDFLQGIARNDWMMVVSAERRGVLQRYSDRRPIRSADNRATVAELTHRIAQRRGTQAGPPELVDNSREQQLERADAFLNSVSDLDDVDQEAFDSPHPVSQPQIQ